MELIKKKIGDFGECLAAGFLKDLKHEILACKYRSLFGELDIVSHENNKLHFVEVKTILTSDISRETNIQAEEHVTREKLAKISKTAEIFMDEFGLCGDCGQIDVIGVYIGRGFYKRHQKDTILGPIKDIDYRLVYLENVY